MEQNIETNLSLWKLQDMVLLAEEEVNSALDLGELIGRVADKIDDIKEVVDILEADAVRWGEYAQAMAQRKKSAENAAKRLKEYVAASLQAHGTTFELGSMWKVQLTTSERVVVEKDPDIDDVLELGDYGVIKTEYSWNKTQLKKLLESENEAVSKVARIEENKGVRFSANNVRK